MDSLSHKIYDREDFYTHQMNIDEKGVKAKDPLTVFFGWREAQPDVFLSVVSNLDKPNQQTIYDSDDDNIFRKINSIPESIGYLEATLKDILGPRYKVSMMIGYNIYLRYLYFKEKQNRRKDNAQKTN